MILTLKCTVCTATCYPKFESHKNSTDESVSSLLPYELRVRVAHFKCCQKFIALLGEHSHQDEVLGNILSPSCSIESSSTVVSIEHDSWLPWACRESPRFNHGSSTASTSDVLGPKSRHCVRLPATRLTQPETPRLSQST